MLSTSAETVQLTVSLNLVAYAFAHLLHGSLSDRFGRRQLLSVGMAGFLFAKIPSVLVLLIIRDVFDRDNAVRIMEYYGMAIGITPAVGSIIGEYIHVLAVLAAGAFILVCWLFAEDRLARSWSGPPPAGRAQLSGSP